MKKTLITIMAVLLIVVMCFTLFACNKDKNKGNDEDQTQQETPKTTQGKELAEADLGVYKTPTDTLVIFAEQYLTNYATADEDVHTALTKALQTQADKMEGNPVSKVVATLDKDGFYSLKFTYKSKDTYVYHKEGSLAKRTANAGEYAGYKMEGSSADFDSTLAVVYNAFLRTVQKAIKDGEAFGKDYKAAAMGDDTAGGVKFGGSVEGAFAFNLCYYDKYGVLQQIGPMSYGLKIYGVLGYNAADTQVAIEIIDERESKTLGGLYYKNETLYLNINAGDYQQKLKIDGADINAIVGGMLGEAFKSECTNLATGEKHAEHSYKDGYCTQCGAKQPAASTGTPFYKHDANYTSIKTALTDLTGGNSIVGTVVGLVGSFLTCTQTTVGSNTRYQYQIDIDKLISTILGNEVLGPMIAESLDDVVKSIFPELDLNGFKGIGGALLLSFDVTGGSNATLAGAQIAYNAAQKDFRWNAEDDEAKLYGPINAAITVSDFAIDNKTKVSVNDSEYTYFSPMNGEVTANIKYTDAGVSTDYKLIARASFNPFKVFMGGEDRDGKAEIILDKADGTAFAHIVVDQLTYKDEKWDSTVTVLYNGTYYQTKASESDFFSELFEKFIKPLATRDTVSNLKPISDYVYQLIDQFHSVYTETQFDKDVAEYRADVNKLQVTEHAYKVETVDGKEKKTDLGVMPSSDFLDAIKANALEAIDAKKDAAKAAIADKDAEEISKILKGYKKEIKDLANEAVGKYNDQLKLEGKNDSLFEGFDIMTLLSNFSALKNLFVKGDDDAKNAEIAKYFDYNLSLTDPKLYADLDASVYNKVIDILKLAMPKLKDFKFDNDAAKVKIDMNYTAANAGKLKVDVNYGGVDVIVIVDIKDCIESKTVKDEDGHDKIELSLKSSCTMKADIKINNLDGKNYVYAASIDFKGWDTNKGTITVSFKESDGKGVTEARDEFVNMVITQKWDGEKYQGFDIVLKLDSRKNDGSAMNGVKTYNIHGINNDGMYELKIDECGITLGIGNFEADKSKELSFGIPTPSFDLTIKSEIGDNVAAIEITDITITNWGKEIKADAFKGINKPAEAEFVTNAEGAMDDALVDIVSDALRDFFYVRAAE